MYFQRLATDSTLRGDRPRPVGNRPTIGQELRAWLTAAGLAGLLVVLWAALGFIR
jgi:hypothetical protein